MSVILILPIFALFSNCRLKYRLKMQAAAQTHFFSCEPLASNVGHPFAGVSECYVVLFFCAPLPGPTLTHSVPCCEIRSRKEERETRRGRIGIHKSNQVCSRFITIRGISSLNLLLEIF